MSDLILSIIIASIWAFCLGHCRGYLKARKEYEKANTHTLQGGQMKVVLTRDLVHKLIEDEGMIAMPKGMDKIIKRKGRIDEH